MRPKGRNRFETRELKVFDAKAWFSRTPWEKLIKTVLRLERTIYRRNPATRLWTRSCETVFWVCSASDFSPEQWNAWKDLHERVHQRGRSKRREHCALAASTSPCSPATIRAQRSASRRVSGSTLYSPMCGPATRRARSRNSIPSEQEYNTGDPPHRQFAPKLEGETCYGGADSRGRSLATLGWRDGFVCRTYGWPESDWRYFARYSPRQ